LLRIPGGSADGQQVERIDLEKIRLLAGDGNYSDRYGLRWEDKPERFDAESIGKLPTLKHVGGKGIHAYPHKPTHVLIQGDNYHALKVLAYTHERAVDVIYIDPPYNTGNKDFKYNDRFVDKEDGYRHSKWLSFMAKRLRLAKTLLKDKGVVLISIDDNEVSQLRLLCDEVLGEENFIAPLVWNGGRKNNSRFISNGQEYVLVYASSVQALVAADVRWSVPKERVDEALRVAAQCWKRAGCSTGEATKLWRDWLAKQSIGDGISRFNGVDENVLEMGPFNADQDLSAPGRNGYRYDIEHPDTKLPCKRPEGGWRHTWATMEKLLAAKRVQFGADHLKVPRGKRYLGEHLTEVMESVFNKERQAAASLLGDLLGEGRFPYPKDVEVLGKLLRMVAPKDAAVLDFFAGSGSTAHAVMQLNAEDGGTRQCILVTNDEGEFKDDAGNVLPGGICTHVTYPRLKKVIEGYTTPKGKEVAGLGENLEFFETAFQAVPKSRRQLQSFVRHSTSLLQLKAGCFTTVDTTPEWSLHTDGTKHLFILFDDCAVEAALERLRTVEGPVIAYVFAYDSDDDSADILGQLPNVTVQEVPQPLLDLFFRIKE
jgi:adenine-specific DNA-methyltransferase